MNGDLFNQSKNPGPFTDNQKNKKMLIKALLFIIVISIIGLIVFVFRKNSPNLLSYILPCKTVYDLTGHCAGGRCTWKLESHDAIPIPEPECLKKYSRAYCEKITLRHADPAVICTEIR